MEPLPENRIDLIPQPEHLVSEAMKRPPEPRVFTAEIDIKQPLPVATNG